MKKENIQVDKHIGTWYVIAERETKVGPLFLLEHEQFGDEAPCICINENGKVILEDIWNGFEDIEDFLENVEVINSEE